MMLTDQQVKELERLQWIKDQLPQFDSDLMTGKVTAEEYHKEMAIFMSEIQALEEKYHVTYLDGLMESPLKNLDKIWRIVGKIDHTEDDFNQAVHGAIEEVEDGLFN